MPQLYWPDQKDLPTQEEISPPSPRVPSPHEHAGRAASAAQPATQRARAPGLARHRRGSAVKRRLRLRARADFHSAIAGRRFHSGRALVGFAVPGSASETRVGVTVSRQIKSSVERTRARRRLREVARSSLLGPDSPLRGVGIRYDVVLIALRRSLDVSFAELQAEASLAALRLAQMTTTTRPQNTP